jgi:antitoxin component of MazEF toxin-antitoxin module
MTVTKEELLEMIDSKNDLIKVSRISSDGSNFLTRIPKEVAEELGITKGNEFEWTIKENSKKIEIKLIQNEKTNKEKNSA